MNTPENDANNAVLAQIVGQEMLTRLGLAKLIPKVVLDVGCGNGEQKVQLSKHYPEAQVLGIDNDFAQVRSKAHSLCADAAHLPLADGSVDLLYSNFLLPWHQDPLSLFAEWRRVIRPEGLLTLSSLGPHTLSEWRGIFPQDQLLQQVDMHDLGDALMQAGFVDPVVDVDFVTFSYRSAETFWRELIAAGILPHDETFRQEFQQVVDERAAAHQLMVTFEIVYGHAWVPTSSGFRSDEQGEVRIPLSHLRRRRLG